MSKAPWYWADSHYDHWAVGLVACTAEDGRIHYALPGEPVTTACNRQKDVELIDGPRIVECLICAARARENRDVIDQRHVQKVIKGHDRTNFIRREQQRKINAGS